MVLPLKKDIFTIAEAKKAGVSTRTLSYYVKKGDLERVQRGVYRKTSSMKNETKWTGLIEVTKSVNGGVVCLVTALIVYEMTDDFLNEYWMAIPHHLPRKSRGNIKIVRMRNFDLGIKEIKLDGEKIKIFDIERTIIDSFRLLDIETAMRALKIYMSGEKGKPNLKKLSKYGKELRCDVSKYIMPFTVG